MKENTMQTPYDEAMKILEVEHQIVNSVSILMDMLDDPYNDSSADENMRRFKATIKPLMNVRKRLMSGASVVVTYEENKS